MWDDKSCHILPCWYKEWQNILNSVFWQSKAETALSRDKNCDNSLLYFLIMLQTASPFHDWFIRQRDYNVNSRKHKLTSVLTKGALSVTAALRSRAYLAVKVLSMWCESKTRWEIKECWPQAHQICCIGEQKIFPSVVVQVHSSGKQGKVKIFSLSFPLTLLWTLGFSDSCSFPNRIKSPRERKLRIKMVVVLSLGPVST